ncbi:MAG TPA: hypothetical protein P5307_02250 [Pirellulaceae bacterium]|nr:hypothetical protein [Planctomycetales bacterium]MCB9939603.1 hypothetical protein [Planctomycetaceae bacterium]HRX77850.1 hypothetical protein [Pirellulaceae bacterium]
MSKSTDSTIARGNFGRRVVKLLTLLILLVAASPYIVAKTPLLNVLLGRIGAEDDLHLTAKSAEFGWFTPLTLRDVSILRDQPELGIQLERIELEQSWLATWLALPDIGKVAIVSPDIALTIPATPLEAPSPRRPVQPIVGAFLVRDASFRANSPRDHEPIIQLSDLNVTVRIDGSTSGRTLTIEPVKLLDNVDLTPEMCDRGLQLIAPLLANSTTVSGSASIELTKCIVPLATQENPNPLKQATISGVVQLHQVQTSMKDSILHDIAGVVAALLRTELPDEMRIADGTEVRFELQDGRVYHEGLSFLLPEISKDMEWRTSGFVGLDETLDLDVKARLPFSLAGDGPLASRLAERPIELHIGGTIDQPKLELPKDRNWLQEAASLVGGGDVSEGVEPLAGAVLELLEQARLRREENAASGAPTVLERMRERLQKGREKRREQDPPPVPAPSEGSISL